MIALSPKAAAPPVISLANEPQGPEPLAGMPPRLRTRLFSSSTRCDTLRYLGRQGLGQLHLLRVRRRVADVIADPATSPALRERLRLVMQARSFGISVLGLRGGAEFTRYVDTGGPVAHNLSAAY